MAARSGQSAPKGVSDKSPPAVAVFGDEHFLKTQAIERLLSQLLEPDQRATGLSEYEGDEAKPADVLDDLRTLPFLSLRRVVIVREADGFITANRPHLEAYLVEPCETGTLILECRSFPSNTRLYKRVAAIGECIECKAPKGYLLPKWLTDRCRSEHGKRLDDDAARFIVDQVGDNLGLLDNELIKLSLYVGSRQGIALEDATALVGQHREQKVFGLLNAMADGDRTTALRLWEEVWQTDKAAPHRAVGGIAYGVRQMLSAHDMLRGGSTADVVARRLYTDAARLSQRLRVFTQDRLRRQLSQLCDADVASKTGIESVQTAVERFIMEHTAAASRRAGR